MPGDQLPLGAVIAQPLGVVPELLRLGRDALTQQRGVLPGLGAVVQLGDDSGLVDVSG